MSSTNYTSYYNPYSTTYCCKTCNPCKIKCETSCQTPCQTVQYVSYPNYCQQPCQQYVCAPACPPAPCPNITYITYIATSTTIPSGGTSIPIGTIIPAGTTTVPTGTVTVINGYTGAPTTNDGGVISNNGFFTMPIAGRYIITGNICFATPASVSATDFRELYIYTVNAVTGLVTAIADDSRSPISGSPTCINVAADASFAAGDRVFLAARQSTSTGATIDTVAATGRLAIVRVC
jgi:hypothetical protein